jgi:hypothetical protein
MWQEEDYNDVMKKAAAASAAYAKPHVTTGYQSLVALQLLTDREGFKAAMLERLESADYESGRVQPLEDAMRAFAANGDIHYIPQLLRAAGEVDLKAQTGAIRSVQPILANCYFIEHLGLPGQTFGNWALANAVWMNRLTDRALDEAGLRFVADGIEKAVREHMARTPISQ